MAQIIRRPPQQYWRWKDLSLRSKFLVSVPILLLVLLLSVFSSDLISTTSHQNQDIGLKMPKSKSKNATEGPKVTYTAVADSDPNVLRYAAMEEGTDGGSMRPLTIYRWANLMAHEDSSYARQLALNLTTLLKDCPFDGFRFETKGTTSQNSKSKQFEFVLFQDSYLYNFASIADPHAFAQHLNTDCEGAGCVFTNLGGDATLVAPKQQQTKTDIYGHCAAFVRGASQEQIVGMWRLVAQTFVKRLNKKDITPKPVWFSTAGTGIAWLHFRFDSRPKYYLYRPFKRES